MQLFQPFSSSSSCGLGFQALGCRSLLGGRAPSGDLHPLAAVLPADAALLGLGIRVLDAAGDLHTLQGDRRIGWTTNGGYGPGALQLNQRGPLPAGGADWCENFSA